MQGGGAPEGIGLQIEGGVHPAAGLQLSGGLRHGEENGVKPAGTLAEPQLQVLALPHGLNTVHRGAQQREHRAGIPGTIRLQLGQMVHLLHGWEKVHRLHEGQLIGDAVNGGVYFQTAHRPLTAGGGLYEAVHPLAEGIDVFLWDGKTGCQLVTAEAVQQVRAGFQSGKQVEPAVGAAGALAGAVLQMDHEAGGGVFFAEAGGYDAHHALMPFLTGKHQRVPLLRPQPLDLGDGVGDLNARRGQIQGMEAMAGTQRVNAFVPLAQMFGYATDLRSKTQGRGQYVMEPSHYEPVPKNIADQIIAGRTKA